jgi:hypothetical protein
MRQYKTSNNNKLSLVYKFIIILAFLTILKGLVRAEEVCPMINGYDAISHVATLDDGRSLKIVLDSPYETIDDYIVEVFSGEQKLILLTKLATDQLKADESPAISSLGYCFERTTFMIN